MSPVAFMRELVAKGMSWEDAAEIAERFEQSVEERVQEALAALAPKRSAAAERQAAYRDRKRNAEHNAEHNDVTHAVTDGVDNATLSLPPSPQTPQPPTHTRGVCSTRSRKADDFDQFWEAYPRKTAKDAARKAWPGAVGRVSVETMIAALERQREWEQWRRGIIPHPATWLRQSRWNDEPPPEQQPRKAHDRTSPTDAKLNAKNANYERAWTGSERAFGRDRQP